MPSYSTYSGFLTYLHHDIRFMIYGFVVRHQILQILSPNRSDLNSLFHACKTTRYEIEDWYKKNANWLHKTDQWGIFHPPTTRFALDIPSHVVVEASYERINGSVAPPFTRLSHAAYRAWTNFVFNDRKASGLLEHLVIDLRSNGQPEMNIPVELLATDIFIWIDSFERLSNCELVMTSEQRKNWDASKCYGQKSFTRLVSSNFRSQFTFDADCAGKEYTGRLPKLQFKIYDMDHKTEVVEVIPLSWKIAG